MKFRRSLRRVFIEELNRLYDIKNSWWRKMADDREAFILIRDNRVHVLVNGGLMLQIRAWGRWFQVDKWAWKCNMSIWQEKRE